MTRTNFFKSVLFILVGVILLGCVVRMLTGCRTTRTVVRQAHSSIKIEDSAKTAQSSSTASSDTFNHFHSEKEEVAGLPGSESELTLSAVELQPVTDAEGNKQGRTFRKDNGRSHATVDVGKDGSVRFKCKEDSLLYVIKRMVKDSISVASVFAQALSSSSMVNHSEIKDSTLVQVVARENGPFTEVWNWGVRVFAVIGLISVSIWLRKKVLG
jgi:hypothetical protein